MSKGEHRLYRIGEAARLLELKTCVLRFWEGEFPQLVPVRTPKGQRLYTEGDMALLRRIRSLLHEQGMTIEGARRVLAGELAAPGASAACADAEARASRRTKERRQVLQTGEYPDLFSAVSGKAAPASPPPDARVLAEAAAELEKLRSLLAGSPDPSPRPSPSLIRPEESEGTPV